MSRKERKIQRKREKQDIAIALDPKAQLPSNPRTIETQLCAYQGNGFCLLWAPVATFPPGGPPGHLATLGLDCGTRGGVWGMASVLPDVTVTDKHSGLD